MGDGRTDIFLKAKLGQCGTPQAEQNRIGKARLPSRTGYVRRLGREGKGKQNWCMILINDGESLVSFLIETVVINAMRRGT